LEKDFVELKKLQNDLGRVATHQDKDDEEALKEKLYLFKFYPFLKNKI